MTGNALPRFHRLAPNVVTFCGYNGRGIGTGTVFGRLLAEHVLGTLSEKDLPLPVTDPDAPALPALEGGVLRGWSPNRPCRRRAAVNPFSLTRAGDINRQGSRIPGPADDRRLS